MSSNLPSEVQADVALFAASAAAPARPSLSGLHDLNTGDPQLAAVLRKLERVQGSDIPIMVLGETGTGKDILAKAIHHDSMRAKRAFVSINCASIPEALIESELFGYEEGAFTGAKRRGAPGKIQMAHGGTLFLDEIGDMPTQLQARLLRVLQDRRVTPLGSGKDCEVDVMLICATNRNLKALMAQGHFRQDLYYRLNGLVVRLPALRERSDFAVVAQNILLSLSRAGQPVRLSKEVMDLFLRYRWPGNIRQLHNLLRTACVMVDAGGTIRMEHLPDDFLEEVQEAQALSLQAMPTCPAQDMAMPLDVCSPCADVGQSAALEPLSIQAHHAPQENHSPPKAMWPASPPMSPICMPGAGRLQDLALQAMTETLRQCKGNVSAAAKLLGVSRNTIYRKKDQLPPDVWG
jgi:transcriptional regulator with PAS, ATPase and Fis domain